MFFRPLDGKNGGQKRRYLLFEQQSRPTDEAIQFIVSGLGAGLGNTIKAQHQPSGTTTGLPEADPSQP